MAPISYRTEKQIADIAERITPLLRAMGVSWADWSDRSEVRPPGAAEVAMAIRQMIAGLKEPGTRVETGRIAVEWCEPGDDPDDPFDIRIFIHIGDVEPGDGTETGSGA